MKYYKVKTKTIELKVREHVNLEKIKAPQDLVSFAHEIYRQLDDDQEHLCIIFLDHQLNITGYKKLFSGSQSSSHADPKIIFRNALLFGGATQIALIHNHPSYQITIKPSVEDNLLTERIKEGAKLLEITLIDHIIISQSSDDSYSYSANGIL